MTDRTILITGCSSGIGFDAAHTLRARGWRVFASCRQQQDCERLTGASFESPRLDYEDEASIHSALDQVLCATGGRLDALFNNGAYAIPGFVEDLPTSALRRIFEANLFGWHTLTRGVLPVMRRQGMGRIVQCSSVLGFVAAPYRGAYVATKFALEGLTDSLRLECRDLGIHVSLIEPGPVATRFNENALAQYRRHIDRDASPRADALRVLEERYAADRVPSRFQVTPAAVTARLIHAVESRRPRDRYFVTTPTYIAEALRRLAPRRWLDAVMARN